MQCAACRAVYSNALDACPRCKRPASTSSSTPEDSPTVTATTRKEAKTSASTATSEGDVSAPVTTQAAPVSTLIEFPGTGRAARPQWRKDLSERVREIQQRRAREAALEAENAARLQAEQPEAADAPQAGLGLVPPPADSPQPNPLVAAALRRIERARQQPVAAPRGSGRGGAATAVARVAEESYQTALELPPDVAAKPAHRDIAPPVAEARTEKTIDAARTSALTAVPTQTTAKAETSTPAAHTSTAAASATRAAVSAKPAATQTKIETGATIATTITAPATDASKTTARRVLPEVIDDDVLERLEAESNAASPQDLYDDRAPLASRFMGGIIDLLVVAFFSSPFAAIIELTSGNWADPRVAASVGGIILVVMFVYLACSTALAGRTWGMSIFSLRVINAENALAPTTGQCVRRAIFYMLSFALGALPVLYAFFDAEARAAHDHLSGTMVVRD